MIRAPAARQTLALALALAACGDAGVTSTDGADATDAGTTAAGTGGPVDPTEGEAEVVPLSLAGQLVRISMALRGRRPGESELAAVEADPDALPAIVDAYLESPDFGATVRDLHNDALLLLTDFGVPPAGFLPKGPLAGADPYLANREIMEAPLRLIEHVVMSGAPYTEIVTADYTLVSAAAAAAWALPFDAEGEAWQVQEPPGDRRRAGVLADSWLFQRHGSTASNANRGRANAIARAFLCVDFLDRDLEIDPAVNFADPNVVAQAVQDNPSCAACHQTLDPLASFFWGYKPQVTPLLADYPIDSYAEGYFTTILGVDRRDPAYFGEQGDSLGDLGRMLRYDPRFSLCAATRAYAYFHQIGLDEVPLARASELQRSLLAGDFDYRAMIRALVLADDFKAGTGPLGRKRARPGQLARLVEDLTGFRWRTDLSHFGLGVIDLMDDSLIGYHVLAGGIDSYFVTRPSYTYSATASLSLRALARQAANAVVEADFAVDEDARRLLTQVSLADTGQAKLRPQLAALHRRFYGAAVAEDDPAIDASLALFQGALELAPGDVRRAWKLTLAALLQDVRIAFY